jgi:hypothetical protein
VKYLIAICLLALSSVSQADDRDYYVDMNIASRHFCGCPDVNNERNFGAGLTVDFKNNWEVKTGFYKNSYSKQSAYVLANRYWESDLLSGDWNLRAGVAAGLVYGYKDTGGYSESISFMEHKIQPAILPNITLGYKNARIMLGFVGIACTLQAEYRFD